MNLYQENQNSKWKILKKQRSDSSLLLQAIKLVRIQSRKRLFNWNEAILNLLDAFYAS